MIEFLESILPFVKGSIDEYLEKERNKLHRSGDAAHHHSPEVGLTFFPTLLNLFFKKSLLSLVWTGSNNYGPIFLLLSINS